MKECNCGRPTNEVSGVCVICKLDGIDKKHAGADASAMGKGERECAVSSCARPVKCKGLCNAHYIEMLKDEGRLATTREGRVASKTCKAAGCGKYIVRKGFCTTHFKQKLAPSAGRPTVGADAEVKINVKVKRTAQMIPLEALIRKKYILETDLSRINTAIEVLREMQEMEAA